MRYVEAPQEWAPKRAVEHPGVFLAGGITGCPDWQTAVARRLDSLDDGTILNPRRANFPIDDPEAAEQQITWEHTHLRLADVVLFWFPAGGAVQPIALYELGAWSMTGKPLAVGVEAGYPRERDVRIQTRLARPEVPVVGNLDALLDEFARVASLP